MNIEHINSYSKQLDNKQTLAKMTTGKLSCKYTCSRVGVREELEIEGQKKILKQVKL